MSLGDAAPLLEGDDAARADAIVRRILEEDWPDSGRPGLEGPLGLPLLRLERRPPAAEARDLVARLVAQTYERLALSDGLAGAVFVAEVGTLVAGAEDDWAPGFEALVGAHLARLGTGELFYGVAGLLLVALERRHRPGGRALVEGLIARLGDLAHREQVGLSWPSVTGGHDTGLAHGVSAIACLLNDAVHCGFPSAAPLADAALAHLASCQSTARPNVLFPPPEEGREPMVAFCKGDLGIASALAASTRPGDSPARVALAEAVRRSIVTFSLTEFEGSFDRIGLCHGSAGAAHQMAGLARAAGDQALLERCREVLRRTMRHLETVPLRDGRFEYIDELRPRQYADLYDGAAGVGLVLQAAISPHPPLWDRLLLARPPLRP